LLEEGIDRRAKKRSVAQDGRDVFKDDARLRKIRHVSHGGPQLSKGF
jgi:hypothetical protein